MTLIYRSWSYRLKGRGGRLEYIRDSVGEAARAVAEVARAVVQMPRANGGIEEATDEERQPILMTEPEPEPEPEL